MTPPESSNSGELLALKEYRKAKRRQLEALLGLVPSDDSQADADAGRGDAGPRRETAYEAGWRMRLFQDTN